MSSGWMRPTGMGWDGMGEMDKEGWGERETLLDGYGFACNNSTYVPLSRIEMEGEYSFGHQWCDRLMSWEAAF